MPPHDRLRSQLIAGHNRHLRTSKPPRIPEAGVLIWRWFIDLHGRRTGTDPIAYTEIEAYCRLHRWPLEPRHIALVLALDAEFLRFLNTRQPHPRNPRRRSSPPHCLTRFGAKLLLSKSRSGSIFLC